MITVFGASGNVGRELVARLHASGHPVRVVTRKEHLAGQAGIEHVIGDLSDPATVTRALAGADRLFLLLAIGGPRPIDDRAVIEQARRAGLRHVVLLSSSGATLPIPLGQHHRQREQWLEESGLDWTFLRPGYFMSNALQWARSIAAAGRVATPVADGATAPIAPGDIAEVAALALTAPGHERQIYTLTGGEILTAREQLAILARTLGRRIECVAEPIEVAVEELRRRSGLPEWVLESFALMWKHVLGGQGATRTETVKTLTGHAPIRFEAWCEANRAAFGG